jgi:hypothetical protein
MVDGRSPRDVQKDIDFQVSYSIPLGVDLFK